MLRAFVAVDISDPVILERVERVRKDLLPGGGGSPVDPKNMHYTLKFLGEITAAEEEKIRGALRAIRFEPFTVRLVGVGAFPRPSRPRILWVGADEGGHTEGAGARRATLSALALEVSARLRRAGFEEAQRFRPHLTITRVKNGRVDLRRRLQRYSEYEFGSMAVSSFSLKESLLQGGKPPIYTDLEVFGAR